jgi:two-component system LytT family response regulator
MRALVVDDEPLGRAGVCDLLARDPEILVVGECGNAAEALSAFRSLHPDLVFLDIQMPGTDGLGLAAQLQKAGSPVIVFVTAHDQHALGAFDVRAVDYVLKPLDEERFAETLARAKQRVREQRPGAWLTRLSVQDKDRTVLVPVDQVVWFEAATSYVKVHVAGGVHLVRERMDALEARLDPAKFFRAHRSALVNLDRIKEVQPYFHGAHLIIMADGAQVRLSRRRRDALEQRLRQSI